ncbi:sulfotransferase family protein [Paracoccus seriniphilus]|uniref:Sulfotransferase family protein n=1 Tax=Paracoccus seriniphilus TaxID=184748 RepID=A0A239PM13_9RHOB|nr:sulfotransferase [Paracoccus seriniphilus]WCR13728.1 sulfotransferase [Paracoccus seriniphilus]SNT68667.1 Sulfotransferase family protein [Paracoccus seriniphilus]
MNDAVSRWDPEGKPRKPRIVGIGAQKAGTSWLSTILAQHPKIWTPPFKEVQFFNHRFVPEHREWLPWHFRRSKENIVKRHLDRGVPLSPEKATYLSEVTSGKMFTERWYRSIFAPAPAGTRPIDITPEYSTLPDEGVDYIRDFLPHAKFIYIIRHPVDRAISQLKMNLRRKKRTPASLEDWLAEIEDPVLMDRGDYAAYLPRWQARFPPDRLLVLPFGRIARDPAGLIREVEEFLGLPAANYSGLHKKVFAAPGDISVPDEARAALRAKLEPQFEFLEHHMSADFNADIR